MAERRMHIARKVSESTHIIIMEKKRLMTAIRTDYNLLEKIKKNYCAM